jgi:ribosome recycling factor
MNYLLYNRLANGGKGEEEAKIALRKIRDDARKDIKAAELAEDAKKRAEKEIDDMIKDFNNEIDKLFAEKEADIMKI